MSAALGSLPSSSTLCVKSPSSQNPYHPSFTVSRNLQTPYRSLVCFSSPPNNKIGFLDQILDYIEGGPKLRKWYGAPDLLLPKDGLTDQEEEEEEEDNDDKYPEEDRDAILVTDGDNEIGQMVILSLILKRARVKALVRDKRAAMEAFGTYVESMAGDRNDRSFIKKALRGVRAIIIPNEGSLDNNVVLAESLKGVQHLILLSQLSVYNGSTGIQALVTGNARKQAERDESVVAASGVPYTIIRAGVLRDTPGGKQGFSFKDGCAAQGGSGLSKEDAAFLCVQALDAVPQTGLVFEVVNGEEKVSDWKELFTALMEKPEP